MKKNENYVKRNRKGSRDILLEFWDPLHISATVEARNFKFLKQIGRWGT